MEMLKKAVAELKHLESRFHELVNPEEAIREATAKLAVHAGEALVELGAKLEAMGESLRHHAACVAAIASHPALSVPPLELPAAPGATEPSAVVPDSAPAAAVQQDAKPAVEAPNAGTAQP